MRILKLFSFTLISVLIIAALIFCYFFFEKPTTPPFTNADGSLVENSIAKIEMLDINGSEQWVLTRSRDKSNPPLLLLHGGPAAPEAEFFRAFNADLEDHFTVVNWHQRGSGWSYTGKETKQDYSIAQNVADLGALIEIIKQRSGHDKVYLLGHSWGSIISIEYIRENPQNIAAYIAVGQVTNMAASEQAGCAYIRKEAEKAGDQKTIETLNQICHPPFDKEYVLQQRALLQKYKGGLRHATVAEMVKAGLATEEGTLRSFWRLFLGADQALHAVWDDLLALNYFEEDMSFHVPMYFAIGRHDYQVSQNLSFQYYQQLNAPCKNFTWFERSGHFAPFEEPDEFNEFIIDVVKPIKGCTNK